MEDQLSPEDLVLLAGIAGPALADAKRIEAWTQQAPSANGMVETPSLNILTGLQKIEQDLRMTYAPKAQNPYVNPPQWSPPLVQPGQPLQPWNPPNQASPPPQVEAGQMEFNFNEPSDSKRIADSLEKITKQLTTVINLLKSKHEQSKVDPTIKTDVTSVQ